MVEPVHIESSSPDLDVTQVHVGTKPTNQTFPSVPFTQLFRYSTRFELFLNALGLVAAVGAGTAQPLMTFIFGRIVQEFVNFGFSEETYYANLNNATTLEEFEIAAEAFRKLSSKEALYLVYIGIFMFAATYIYMAAWVYTGEANTKRIREKYLQAVLRQEVAYVDTVGAGEITTCIQTDTHLVQNAISEKVTLVVNFIACFVVGFILAYIRSWRLALAISAILPCIGISSAVMLKLVSRNTRQCLQYIAEGSSLAEEIISTVRTTQAFGIQKVVSGLYDTHVEAARAIDAKTSIVNGVGLGVIFFVIYAAYALAFQFGTTLINEGHANAGQVVNVFLAILVSSFSLVMLAPEIQAVISGQAAAAKLFDTIERTPDIDSSDPGGLKPEEFMGEITLENVKFNYPSRPDVSVIRGLDITFAAGQTTALVGASGSGRTAILSLIERFYDPLGGSVKLDGVDIRDLNVKWLRSQIGLVSREPTLFATTIKDNVAHGLINSRYEHISDEEKFNLIKEACIKANADDFISKLPNGYDTVVGERGFLLSGGQKQCVAIARAIVSDPRILLLDEVGSALDTRYEKVVQNALDKVSAGRTTVTIAHRLSTIKDVGCIYVIGEGTISEKGTHTELLADENSVYSRLVQIQKLQEKVINTAAMRAEADMEKATEDIQFNRKNALRSSDLITQEKDEKKQEFDQSTYNLLCLLVRIVLLCRNGSWKYAVGLIFAIVTGMVFPSISIVYGQSISDLSQPDPTIRREYGNKNALWFFIISILSAHFTALQNYFFSSASAMTTSKVRSDSFKAMLRQDIEYFDKNENSAGALAAYLSDNPQKLNGLAGVTLGSIVQVAATIVGGSVIGLIYAWKPALVGVACLPFVIWTGKIRLRIIATKDQQSKKTHENSTQIACEAVNSIRTVASLTGEENCLKQYSESLNDALTKSNKATAWSSLLYAFSQSLSFFIVALIFYYGSNLVSRQEIKTMSFFVSLMSTTIGTLQASNVISFAPDISSASNAGAATIKLLDSIPKIDADSTEGQMLNGEHVRGQIQLQNVYFQYPTRPNVGVLQDLSLKIEPGTYVALVGANGCGKSAIIQLIERFYDPLAGHVLLDGKPINEFNVQQYRKQIALVSQKPILYAGTILFNVLLGATKPESEVTQKEIEAACRGAHILDFIKSLPDGFATQVSGKGLQLSDGQKQQIAIARALLRNSKVLLLDEATSALDSASGQIVQQVLNRAAKGRTTISVTHRLSSIQSADRICFIKDGRVSEAGSHNELLSLRGDYYEYVRLQVLSDK